MRITRALTGLAVFIACGCAAPKQAPYEGPTNARTVVQTYAELAHRSYGQAYQRARALQDAIEAMLDRPTGESFEAARRAWIDARTAYAQTEALRYFGGPDDPFIAAGAADPPEQRISPWPVNPETIDYVRHKPSAGMVHHIGIEITLGAILNRNVTADAVNATVGFHAIEFLLWGAPFDEFTVGGRTSADYRGLSESIARRRKYLRLVASLLVDDLALRHSQWAPGSAYRDAFVASESAAMRSMLSVAGAFAGSELAGRRLEAPMTARDPQRAIARFSDTTHQILYHNVLGLENVYWGKFDDFEGATVHQLIAERDSELADRIRQQIADAARLVREVEPPFTAVIVAEPGSMRRQPLETLASTLKDLSASLKQAAEALGAPPETATP